MKRTDMTILQFCSEHEKVWPEMRAPGPERKPLIEL